MSVGISSTPLGTRVRPIEAELVALAAEREGVTRSQYIARAVSRALVESREAQRQRKAVAA